MAATAITISNAQLRISLAQLGATVSDTPSLLAVIGGYMLGSIARTFRDEGSPAGSWPELAESTKKKKGYAAGHKLLILSGRLFGSINYQGQGNTVVIGSGLKYAAVHQFGSVDRSGGSVGPQAKLEDRAVAVSAHKSSRLQRPGFGVSERTRKDGKFVIGWDRAAGPANKLLFDVAAHARHQNIPARPYLVFRPEDEGNIAAALSAYMRRKAPSAVTS